MRLKFFGLAFSLVLLLTIANPVVAFQKEENLIKISNALQQEKEHPRLIKLINWSYIKCMLECALKDPVGKNGSFLVLGICLLSLIFLIESIMLLFKGGMTLFRGGFRFFFLDSWPSWTLSYAP